jgi:hypothetical protein
VSLNITSGIVPCLGRLVADLALRRLGLSPMRFHVGFVVEKVVLEQDFLRILRISPVSSVPPILHSYPFICHRVYITPKIERFYKWHNTSAIMVQVRKSKPTNRSLTSQLF